MAGGIERSSEKAAEKQLDERATARFAREFARIPASLWQTLSSEQKEAVLAFVIVEERIVEPVEDIQEYVREAKEAARQGDEKGVNQKIARFMGHSEVKGEDRVVVLQRHIGSRPEQLVFEGELRSQQTNRVEPVVIKWLSSSSLRPISFELDIWKRLQAVRPLLRLPRVWTHFQLWKEPILVMERLQPLDVADSAADVGIALIPLLRALHENRIGVYNDLKPGNVLNRRKMKTETGEWNTI